VLRAALFEIASVPIEAGDFPQIEHRKNVYAGDDKRNSFFCQPPA
jgi:hypothetical protein